MSLMTGSRKQGGSEAEAMKIHLDGEDYEYDMDEMTVQQARVIKVAFGFNLQQLQDEMASGNPDAISAVYWLMLAQSGVKADPKTVDFKITRFMKAIEDAWLAEHPEDADPKSGKLKTAKA